MTFGAEGRTASVRREELDGTRGAGVAAGEGEGAAAGTATEEVVEAWRERDGAAPAGEGVGRLVPAEEEGVEADGREDERMRGPSGDTEGERPVAEREAE